MKLFVSFGQRGKLNVFHHQNSSSNLLQIIDILIKSLLSCLILIQCERIHRLNAILNLILVLVFHPDEIQRRINFCQ